MLLFKGKNVVFPGGVIRPASLVVSDGKIIEILDEYVAPHHGNGYDEVIDAGDMHLIPGVVDSHVHVNEPGRTEWEGYSTATQAAAAGGITTLIDMPLNSLPPTTSVTNFRTKVQSAQGKCHVDVGFWGGVVPRNQMELIPMLNEGVLGFKCFMIDSGVEEFPKVTDADIRLALEQLQGTSAVFMCHAEDDSEGQSHSGDGDPREYSTFLASRPDSWEVAAIDTVCQLCLEYSVRCHVVHLATSEPLSSIRTAKESGASLTVETTHHYLTLESETVPDGATEYKCCPPIRNKKNQTDLWDAVQSGLIDMVVSDHSPCTPDLKLLEEGDFMKAWGGIASVQFGLSLFWTGCAQRGLDMAHLTKNLCESPAALCGLGDVKGRIAVGMDADLVIWDPHSSITITKDNIHHKNKVTPYVNRELQGKVLKTFVRGQLVYEEGRFADVPKGKLLLAPQVTYKAAT